MATSYSYSFCVRITTVVIIWAVGLALGVHQGGLSPLRYGTSHTDLYQAMNEITSFVERQVDPKVVTERRRNAGRFPSYAAASCREVIEHNKSSPSGLYWILNATKASVEVFCNMDYYFGLKTSFTKGWVRLALLNMTDPKQQCPPNWRLYNNGIKRLCGKKTGYNCESTVFPAYGLTYRSVFGRVIGYQYGSPDAFSTTTRLLDGVTISHGSLREHVWTYAAGNTESSITPSCPCARGHPPSSVYGSNYYCESGWYGGHEQLAPENILFLNDTLWDGLQCGNNEGPCCNNPLLPWFFRELPSPTTDDLEVSICTDESLSNEDVPVELIEIYVQ